MNIQDIAINFICSFIISIAVVIISKKIEKKIDMKNNAPNIFCKIIRSENDFLGLNNNYKKYKEIFKMKINAHYDIPKDDNSLITRTPNIINNANFKRIGIEDAFSENEIFLIAIDNKSDTIYNIKMIIYGKCININNWPYNTICEKQKIIFISEIKDKIDKIELYSNEQNLIYSVDGKTGLAKYKVKKM